MARMLASLAAGAVLLALFVSPFVLIAMSIAHTLEGIR